MKLIYHTDGACSMKRGVAAGAAVLFTPDGSVLAEQAVFLRCVTTPVAEYAGLILALEQGLELAQRYEISAVEVWMDAELVARQARGQYRCRDPFLSILLARVRELVALLEAVGTRPAILEFPKGGPENKRRWSNHVADALANRCREGGQDVVSRALELPGAVSRATLAA